MWICGEPGWSLDPGFLPPVPVSEIKFWEHRWLVTHNNEVWWHDEYHDPVQWVNVGVPGGPTPAEPTTWGKIKAEFQE